MGRPRTRRLVEEIGPGNILAARAMAQLVRQHGHIARAMPMLRERDPAFPHLILLGYRTRFGVVWLLQCGDCSRRRRALYRVHGRWACRACQGLYYAVQARRWDLPLIEQVAARTRSLAQRPGPKGRGWHAWIRRAGRIESTAVERMQRFEARWQARFGEPFLEKSGSPNPRTS